MTKSATLKLAQRKHLGIELKTLQREFTCYTRPKDMSCSQRFSDKNVNNVPGKKESDCGFRVTNFVKRHACLFSRKK